MAEPGAFPINGPESLATKRNLGENRKTWRAISIGSIAGPYTTSKNRSGNPENLALG